MFVPFHSRRTDQVSLSEIFITRSLVVMVSLFGVEDEKFIDGESVSTVKRICVEFISPFELLVNMVMLLSWFCAAVTVVFVQPLTLVRASLRTSQHVSKPLSV